jgi:hypothetical protein
MDDLVLQNEQATCASCGKHFTRIIRRPFQENLNLFTGQNECICRLCVSRQEKRNNELQGAKNEEKWI